MSTPTPKRKVIRAQREPEIIKAESFQCVTFYDDAAKRQVIVLYALGSDGIVREYNGQTWRPYPIERD